MTAAQSLNTEKGDAAVNEPAIAETRLKRLDELLDRWSEWLNPILVKETRQSLKSRAIMSMFLLVLVCAWAWSFLGIAMAPQGSGISAGGVLLTGYTGIMLFPLFVAIPFSAFHSFSTELEDGTYALVSITTLRPGQIVSGRMAVAGVQLVLFLSALAPCIAFTYLLRGVDLFLIVLLLFHASWFSLLLTSLALFVATVGQVRRARVLLSMLLLVALLVCFFIVSSSLSELLSRGRQLPYDVSDFWEVQACLLSFGATAFALLHFASIARIGIISANRSTALRVTMLFQQALAVFWASWFFLTQSNAAILYVFALGGIAYWFVMGSLLVGESPGLHHRGRRKLPESLLGRAVLTWVQPGPGSGYVFATANCWSLLVMLVATLATQRLIRASNLRANEFDFAWILFASGCLFTIYLGVCRLIIAPLRRFSNVGPPFGLMVMLVLLLVGTFLPVVLVEMYDAGPGEYGLIQMSSFPALLQHMQFQGSFNRAGVTPSVGDVALPCVAAAVLLVNLVFVGAEVRRKREATPERVLAERQASMLAPTQPAPDA